MALPPPPPSITPRQMNLLRIVTYMAWCDGELSTKEVDIMLARFSRLFAGDKQQQDALEQELRDYMMQNVPLEELVPKLANKAEKELVLQLGYETIAASSRSPEEPNINPDEERTYQQLVRLLDLTPEEVDRLEAEVRDGIEDEVGLVEKLARKLEAYASS